MPKTHFGHYGCVCVLVSKDMHRKCTNCYPVFAQFLTCKRKKMAKEVFLLCFTYIFNTHALLVFLQKQFFIFTFFKATFCMFFLVFVIKLYIICHQNLVFPFIFLIKKFYIFSCLVLIHADFIKKKCEGIQTTH